jgi:hypothetical protein
VVFLTEKQRTLRFYRLAGSERHPGRPCVFSSAYQLRMPFLFPWGGESEGEKKEGELSLKYKESKKREGS